MRAIIVSLIGLTGALTHAAEILPPPVIPRPADTGVIRIWGNAETAALVARWRDAFPAPSPSVRLETNLTGSDVAMAGLTTGKADLALLGRDATAAEVKAFEWVFRHRPLRIEVATGSASEPGKSPALALYVHRDNPLRRLTLAQVDAIFGRELRHGAPRVIETWAGAGLADEWGGRVISIYAPDTESGTGRFFREAALGDSRHLAWDRLTEFNDTRPEAQPTHDASAQILAALARDRFGLAVAAAGSAHTDVRMVPLALTDAGPDLLPTPENLIRRRYPLTRTLVAYVNCQPGTPLDARLAEFLRHLLSDAGQRAIAADGGYLPLSASSVEAQRKLLP